MGKFVKDSMDLIHREIMMPGTILDPKTGTPALNLNLDRRNQEPRTFPNRMIRSIRVRQEIEALLKPGMNPTPTMDTVRKIFEPILADSYALRQINLIPRDGTYRISPSTKITIRKMMSHYWENWSPFALNLSGAVMRQGIFMQKMVKIDWLHSPHARDTMQRLLEKYRRFVAIMASYPGQIAVPTLDVDLAWHTHQLCPPAYYRYTMEACQKFIDHDDKIDEGKLSSSFEWTSKIYQQRFGEVYSECTCWYCEGILRSDSCRLAAKALLTLV